MAHQGGAQAAPAPEAQHESTTAADRSSRTRAAHAARRAAAEESAIELTRGWRVSRVDARNWALQRRSGAGWESVAYHGELDGALELAARRLTNVELVEAAAGGASLTDVVRILDRTRTIITDELRALAAQQGRAS